MAIKLNGSSRSFVPSLRVSAFLIFIFFVITYIIIYNVSFSEPSWITQDALKQNIENLDDYDASCSGYSIGRILREQKRILASVRLELTESQVKIEEIRTVQEELQRLIPQKQLELSALEGEIEAAQRQLEELRETQNVKVFLPFSPLQIPRELEQPSQISPNQLDDIIDYSRCSISSFMPVYVDIITSGQSEKEWLNVFQEVIPNLVETPDKACIKIHISNGIASPNTTFNSILFNVGSPIINFQSKSIHVQASKIRSFDFPVDVNHIAVEKVDLTPLLPFQRENLISLIVDNTELNFSAFSSLSAEPSRRPIVIVKCSQENCSLERRRQLIGSSTFCFLLPSEMFFQDFLSSLQLGCIPIILSNSQLLPFQDLIDWRRATYRLPLARLPEAHFIVQSFEISDIIEMRRVGRLFYETYLADRHLLARSLLAALRYKLQIPTREVRRNQAIPLFNSSFTAPKGSVVNVQANFDDEYLLGPLESRVESTSYAYNFTEFQLYSYDFWNIIMSPHYTKEFLVNAAELPTEAEFFEDTKIGFRPIEPGSGAEFSKALGGNRQREQFTVVLLTYERDAVLTGALERLHQLPYLNKIIVVWNNVNRDPPDSWPSLHIPVEFIRVAENNLNNRFVPWDRIETEAVLSLDDDIDLMQQEIILAFRVWRENRDRIVGFPARHHARYGDSMFYNSNHTCQMSMILTGAAFIHKNYLTAYTYEMPAEIREHVNSIKNCEDIAMNYLVSHLTRKPPIKTTSRWTLKCPTCTESLYKEGTHFEKRHECMRLFTKIYGYNPLKFSQFRADSILFKTRLPQNHQKCFKYV
nr:multiple exostoses homolog 2 [Caenorhabditis elegans]